MLEIPGLNFWDECQILILLTYTSFKILDLNLKESTVGQILNVITLPLKKNPKRRFPKVLELNFLDLVHKSVAI